MQANNKPFGEPAEAGPSAGPVPPGQAATPAAVQEDDVDLILYQQSGAIQRPRDEKL